MTVAVGIIRVFTVTNADGDVPDNLDAETDQLMDALLSLEGDDLMDSAVGVNLADGEVEIEIAARAKTFALAVEKADGAIRTAIHAVGGKTNDEDWDGWKLYRETNELVSA